MEQAIKRLRCCEPTGVLSRGIGDVAGRQALPYL